MDVPWRIAYGLGVRETGVRKVKRIPSLKLLNGDRTALPFPGQADCSCRLFKRQRSVS